MAETILSVVAWFFIGYFFLINGGYLFIHTAALLGIRRDRNEKRVDPPFDIHESPFIPGIAVILPAYNEAPVITSSVRSLLSVEYPDFELVVVNDGSTDHTLERLHSAFDLQRVDATYPIDVPTERIRDVYRAPDVNLVVIDKENGGKADALNVGLFFTDQPLFCAVDADTVIERDALIQVVKPFLRDPERMVATGGTVRVANGCSIRDGVVQRVRLSSSALVSLQTMEYLRAFLAGRVGLSVMNSLLIISGAFGLFRTNAVREIGGYSTDTITEDMELIVRLHRHFSDRDEQYRVEFIPDAVVWTEVPETRQILGRQRSRWYRGLLESLLLHRGMIARKKYGTVGLLALPFFLFVEAFGPLVEGMGYVFIPIGFVFGLLNAPFFLLFLAVAVGLGTLMSWLSVLSEVYAYRRYTHPKQILSLLFYGIAENVLYRQWKAYVAWKGLLQFLRGDTSWGEMSRSGLETE